MSNTSDTGIPLTGYANTMDTGIPQQSPQQAYQRPPADDYGGTWQNASGQQTDPTHTNGPSTPAPATQSAQYAMPGWDQTKWANPEHNTIKYQAGRIFSQFDPNAIRQNPAPRLAALKAAGINATMVGDDKIDFGDGYGPIDVITRGGQWAWQPGGGGAPAPTAMAPAGAMAGAAGGYGASGGSGGGGAFGDQIKAMVLKLMGQQPTDVMTDPVYRGAMDAYNTQQQRNTEVERNAMAERMAAEGTLNTGGFTDRVARGEQVRGENTANFAGQLGIRELERQREEVMQALQLGAGMMTDEQRLALTEKLGMINASLQQQSITNQNNQFNSSLGWQMAQYPSQQAYLAWLYGGGGA
jgi:hypothetical protein